MRTRVVNLRKEPYDIYIGRAGKGQDGYFGNPIARGKSCPVCGKIHLAAGDTIPCYECYFKRRIKEDEKFFRRIMELGGKTLGCFCKPGPGHGDVIAFYVDNLCPGLGD